MNDENKTRKQLISELADLRRKTHRLEKMEINHRQAEELLKKLGRQNDLILNAAGEGILGLDVHGKHTFVNPAAARMLGYTEDELIGRRSHAIWHSRKSDGSPHKDKECPIYAAYKDGKIHGGDDEVFWRKDGTCFKVQYTSTPIKENDKIIGAVVTFMDITERKKIEKEILMAKKELETFFSVVPDLFCIITKKDGYFKFLNRNWEKTLGFAISELLSKPFKAWIHPDDVAPSYAAEEMLKRGETLTSFVNRYRCKDGSYRWLEWVAVPPQGEFIYGAARDITERKQVEKALSSKTHELKERVKELDCLYGLSRLIEKPGITLEEIYERLVNLIPAAWQYPEITCARVILGDREFRTDNFRDTKWKQISDITGYGKKTGCLEVCYLEEMPESYEGPFLREERELLKILAERIGSLTIRRQTQEALKKAHDALEIRVKERTAELVTMTEHLKKEIEQRAKAEEALIQKEKDLAVHAENLDEVNKALRVLLKKRDEDKRELEEKILLNIKELVLPYLEKIKETGLDEKQSAYAGILESHLKDIILSFTYRLSSTHLNLTPQEIRVANLVREGKTNKEIAKLLNVARKTAEFHRESIRKKLGITNKKTNLRSYLISIK